MGNMYSYPVAYEFTVRHQRQEPIQVLTADIPVVPIGDLHLTVGPSALILILQIFEIVFLIASYYHGSLKLPKCTQALIGPGSAEAIITCDYKVLYTLTSCIFEHGIKSRLIAVNIRYNSVSHTSGASCYILSRLLLQRLTSLKRLAIRYDANIIPAKTRIATL